MQILQGLELLLDCPWSTGSAEQQHASATMVRRQHPEYGLESVRIRACVHSLRLLLPSKTNEEKQLAKQVSVLARLEAKQPSRLTGRHLYVRELIQLAQSWRSSGVKSVPPDISATIIKRHGVRWKALPASRRAIYESQAALARSARTLPRKKTGVG